MGKPLNTQMPTKIKALYDSISIEDKLKNFNIITGLEINSIRDGISIEVTQSKCKQYPNELKDLQMLLHNQKEVEYKLTLIP